MARLPAWEMTGRCHQTWNPPAPPHPAWRVYTATSERLNSGKTLSVLPCSAEVLSSSEECVWWLLKGSGFPLKSHRTSFIWLFLHSSTQSLLFMKRCSAPFHNRKPSRSPHVKQPRGGGIITAATKTPFQNSSYGRLVALLSSWISPVPTTLAQEASQQMENRK